ncbi:hypothetical protein HZC31_04810 [Candidatus Woesearchaeota archaeon]|nr:hypothetical protein [Candidatus Woesearchaeota archaeon]
MPAVVNGRSRDPGRMTLEASVLQCEPVLKESIAMYGARVVGKDTITDALSEDTRFRKISSHAPFRQARAGEEFAVASGIEARSRTLTQLQEDPLGYVAWFTVDDDLYAISPHAFDGVEIPIVHITGINGLNALKKYPTLPYKLRVLITTDPTQEDHLRSRVISRLQGKRQLPLDFSYDAADAEQRTLINRRLQQSIDSIREFEEQDAVNYHAVFVNNALRSDDLRPFIYPRRAEQHDYDILATDIARRIKALFEIYSEFNRAATGRDIVPAHLHNRYVTACSTDLFTRKPSVLKVGRRLSEGLLDETVPRYARERGLQESLLQELVASIKIVDIDSGSRTSGSQGRFSIYLQPSEAGPVSLQDIKEKRAGTDYFVLRALGERVTERRGTWCRYDVRDGLLYGVSFSLTDRIPAGQGPGMYHELWVGFR